jgi:hypothetical protein
MPRTIRVKLTPTPVPDGEGSPARVKGLFVSLLELGKGTSAGGTAPQPCTLTFQFGFREKLRDGSVAEPKKLATLDGTLELRSSGPVFTATQAGDAAAPLAYDPAADVGDRARGAARLAPPVDETPPPEAFPRILELQFEGGSFEGVLDADEQNQRLLVPAEPEGMRYLELFAELSLAGADEAPLDTNDVLDVLLSRDNPPRNDGLRLILASVDDVQLPEVALSIAFDNGVTLDGKLNRDGEARVLDAPRGFFEVTYADLEDVRAKVMAGRARQAIAKREIAIVLGVLGQSPTLLSKVQAAYDTFFNDLGGQGLVGDARALVKGSDSEPWAEHLIALGELRDAQPTELFAMNEPVLDPAEDFPAAGETAVV